VLFVGDFGVGKTSVCKRLQNEKFDKNEKSTNGADIFIQVFEVDLSTDEKTWKQLNSNYEQRLINRVGDVIASKKGSQGMVVSLTKIIIFLRAITSLAHPSVRLLRQLFPLNNFFSRTTRPI